MGDGRESNEALSWVSGELKDPRLEAAFRAFDFESEKRRVLAFAALTVTIVLLFMTLEALFSRRTDLPVAMQATRVILLGFMTAMSLFLTQVKDWRLFGRITYGGALLFAAVACVIPLSRPPEYLWNTVFDVALVLSYYLLFRFPLRLLVIPPIGVTLVDFFVLHGFQDTYAPYPMFVVATALVFANLMGMYAARQRNAVSRLRFLEYEKERQLREELERALSRVKHLEGLAPICSHCKRIRNEQGDWEELEAFIERGTCLEFSHSFCPECAEKHYGVTGKPKGIVKIPYAPD